MTESLAVIDASFAIRLLPINPSRDIYWAIVDRLENERINLVAPSLWMYETTSAVTKAARFDEVSVNQAHRLLQELAALHVRLIEPDAQQCALATDWTLRLRRSAAYDSFYLSFAETLGCDLWTANRRLRNAVNLPWVRFVGDNE